MDKAADYAARDSAMPKGTATASQATAGTSVIAGYDTDRQRPHTPAQDLVAQWGSRDRLAHPLGSQCLTCMMGRKCDIIRLNIKGHGAQWCTMALYSSDTVAILRDLILDHMHQLGIRIPIQLKQKTRPLHPDRLLLDYQLREHDDIDVEQSPDYDRSQRPAGSCSLDINMPSEHTQHTGINADAQ
jgi:hypothetical protein